MPRSHRVDSYGDDGQRQNRRDNVRLFLLAAGVWNKLYDVWCISPSYCPLPSYLRACSSSRFRETGCQTDKQRSPGGGRPRGKIGVGPHGLRMSQNGHTDQVMSHFALLEQSLGTSRSATLAKDPWKVGCRIKPRTQVRIVAMLIVSCALPAIRHRIS